MEEIFHHFFSLFSTPKTFLNLAKISKVVLLFVDINIEGTT